MTDLEAVDVAVLVKKLLPLTTDEQARLVRDRIKAHPDKARVEQIVKAHAGVNERLSIPALLQCIDSDLRRTSKDAEKRQAQAELDARDRDIAERDRTIDRGRAVIGSMTPDELVGHVQRFFKRQYGKMPPDERAWWEKRFNPHTNIVFALMVAEQEREREECPV